MSIVWSVRGNSMQLLRSRAATVSTAIHFFSVYFALGSLSLYEVRAVTPLLRTNFNLAEAQETGPLLSLVLLPDREIFAPAFKACPSFSSDWAVNAVTLASVLLCSSRNYLRNEKLLEVITRSPD